MLSDLAGKTDWPLIGGMPSSAFSRLSIALPLKARGNSSMAQSENARPTSYSLTENLAWHAEFNLTLADLSRALTSLNSIEDVAELVLDRARRLTSSSLGFVGYLDPTSGHLVCPALTREVWGLCQLENKKQVFEGFRGVHGRASGPKNSVLCNDLVSEAGQAGLPAGHLAVERFLSAPAFLGDELVGQVALANPERDYTDRDLAAAQALADLFALAVQQNRFLRELRAVAAGWRRDLEPEQYRGESQTGLVHVESQELGLAHTDREGRYLWTNQGLCRILGHSREELLASSLRDISLKEPQSAQETLWAKLWSRELPEYSIEQQILRKDGSPTWCRITFSLLDNPPPLQPVAVGIYQDINSEMQARQNARLSFEEKAAILDALDDSVVLQDPNFKVLWANQPAAKASGLALNEILGRPCHQIWHDLDHICPDCQIERCLETGQTEEQEVHTPDGRTFFIRANPLRDGRGEVVAAVKLVRDITEQTKAQHILEENEKLLRTVLEASTDGWWRYVVKTDEMFLSPNVWKLLEREVSQRGIKHKERVSLIHPQDRKNAIEALSGHLAGKTSSMETELRLGTAKGGWRWFLCRGRVVETDPRKQPVLVVGTLMDIDERKQAQNALKQSEALHRSLFENMAQGAIYKDASGRITAANPAAARILGLSDEDIRHLNSRQHIWKAIREDGSELHASEHPSELAFKTGEPVLNVPMGFRKQHENKTSWIRASSVPQFKEGEDRPYQVFTTFEDITKIKEQEAEQARLIKELFHALTQVKKLSGLLPICASCKKIRDDQGYWQEVESYFHEHSDAQFSHSICPECKKKLYPDLFDDE